jgi:peptidoglycan hydrolase-like protein with peptidoglycan-binding domain
MRATTAIVATLTALVTAGSAVTVNAAPAQAAWPPCFDFATQAWVVPPNTGLVASWHLPSVVRETRSDGFRAENINCRLGVGDAGAGVFVLQGALRDCLGHTSLRADGVYGPLTRNAIIWEQARNGFQGRDVDGVYGPKTRAVLRFPLLINGVFSGDCRQG